MHCPHPSGVAARRPSADDDAAHAVRPPAAAAARSAATTSYLEPDLVAFQLGGQFHVVEIKSFAVIDGQADGEQGRRRRRPSPPCTSSRCATCSRSWASTGRRWSRTMSCWCARRTSPTGRPPRWSTSASSSASLTPPARADGPRRHARWTRCRADLTLRPADADDADPPGDELRRRSATSMPGTRRSACPPASWRSSAGTRPRGRTAGALGPVGPRGARRRRDVADGARAGRRRPYADRRTRSRSAALLRHRGPPAARSCLGGAA